MAVPDLKINVLLETGKWKEALAQSQTDLRAFASQAAASSASSAAAIKQIEDSVKGVEQSLMTMGDALRAFAGERPTSRAGHPLRLASRRRQQPSRR